MLRYLLFSGTFIVLLAADSQAALQHKYTFEAGNVNDSVGGANGTLENNAQVFAGQLMFGADIAGAAAAQHYVSLPGSTIGLNTYTELTLEMWVTPNSANNERFTWPAAFGRFGNAADIEVDGDQAEDTYGHEYVASIITSLGNSAGVLADDHFTTDINAEGPNSIIDNSLHHLVTTVVPDTVDPQLTTISQYIDGVLVGTATGSPSLADVSIEEAFLGRSLYTGDDYFLGTLSEFSIYDNALDASAVTTNFAAGPTGPEGPKLVVDRASGTLVLSNMNSDFNVTTIDVSSAAGALDPTKWLSVSANYDSDNGGAFDSDDPWTENDPGTYLLWSESETAGDGGVLGTGGSSSLMIGAPGAWQKSPIEDVQLTLEVIDSSFNVFNIPVEVEYVNGTQAIRSDLDFDGDIDGDDWTVFSDNHLTSMPGLPAAATYAFGDLNGDGSNNFADFKIFESDYDAANGAGTFASLVASNVPEPSSLLLLVTACFSWALSHRRK